MTEDDPCAALVRAHDRDRWATARLAGPADGPEVARLMALYAFEREIARIPDMVSEPMLGEIRLQWWRDALSEIFEGATPRGHEVVAPLAAAIRDADLPRDLFEAFLDARSHDIHGPAFADRPLFDAYVDGAHASLARLAARALGGDEADERAARLAGRAFGVAALIRSLPRIYARGGDPVPTPEPLDRNALAEGRTPEGLRVELRGIALDALESLSAARAMRPAERIHPALLAGWRAEGVLKAAAAKGFELFGGLPEESDFARRWGLAWRVLRGRW